MLRRQAKAGYLSVFYMFQIGDIVRLPLSNGNALQIVQFSLSGITTYSTVTGGASGRVHVAGLPHTHALSVVQNGGFGAPMGGLVWAASDTSVWSIDSSGTEPQWHSLQSGDAGRDRLLQRHRGQFYAVRPGLLQVAKPIC